MPRTHRLLPALALAATAAGAQPVVKDGAAPAATRTDPVPALDSATLGALRWRPVGPTNMAGRIADIEGIPSPSKTFYVVAAGGGVWKTTNNGTTFRPIFDDPCVPPASG